MRHLDDMRLTIARWDQALFHDRHLISGPWPYPIEQRRSILYDPTTEEQVAGAEHRLGLRLPPSYRNFLLVSNGADASSLGIEAGWSSHESHVFVPVEDIRFLRQAHPTWVELWCEVEGDDIEGDYGEERPAPGQITDRPYFPRAAGGLLISSIVETYFDVLVPPASSDGEWELWTTYKEGATAYHSFADALIFLTKRAQRGTALPHLVEEYAANAAQGKYLGLEQLSDIDPARAADVVAALLQDPQIPQSQRPQAARALATLIALGHGTQHRPLLDRLATSDEQYMSTCVLEGLVMGGDRTALDALTHREQTSDDATVRRHAAAVARRGRQLFSPR